MLRYFLLAAAVFALLHLSPALAGDRAERRIIRVSEKVIADLPGVFDIAGYNLPAHAVDIVASPELIEFFEEHSIGFEVLPRQPAEAVDNRYTDYAEAVTKLQELTQSHASTATLVDVTKTFHVPPTQQGRDIWALKITGTAAGLAPKPAIAFNGNQHARELVTVETVLDIAEQLLSNYGKDKEITAWLDAFEIWLIPSLNPDGLTYVFTADNWWRKNRRNNGNEVFGVDINRNYPFKWGQCNGSSASPSSDIYRGPQAASEPESQTLIALATQKHLMLNVSYHSYGNVVLYPPYGCTNAKLPAGEDLLMASIAKEYASKMTRDDGGLGYEVRNRLYSVDGLDRDWMFSALGTVALVTEIGGTDFQPDYALYRDKIVHGLRPGWRYLLQRMLGGMLRGQVLDASSKKPLAADYAIAGFSYYEGEKRSNDPATGSYHLVLNAGSYKVSFTAPGYQSQTIEIAVGTAPVAKDILLQKTAP